MVRAAASGSAFWRALSTLTWIESATKRSPSSPAEAVTRLTLKSCQRTSSSDMRRVEDSGQRDFSGARSARHLPPHRSAAPGLPEELRDRHQRVEGIGGEMVVHGFGKSARSRGHRRVAGRARERVEPEDTVGRTLERSRFVAEQRRITALPAIGHEQGDGAPTKYAARPAAIELAQGVADARASRPIRH